MQRVSDYKRLWRTALSLCLGASVCVHASAATVRIGGSGAAIGTMRLLGQAFEEGHPDHAVRVFDGLGTSGGIKALRAKRLDIAVASRNIEAGEKDSGLTAHRYGTSAFVFASHPDTPFLSLTQEQIAGIYANQLATWPNGKPLRLVLTPRGDSDTELLGRISPEVRAAVEAAHARKGMIVAMTDTAVADQVETTPGAFATSTLAVILSEGRHVTVHAVDGIVPSVDSLTTGSYPYVKDMYMFTSRQPSDAAKQFLEFVRSAQGAEILRAAGHKTD